VYLDEKIPVASGARTWTSRYAVQRFKHLTAIWTRGRGK